VLQDIRNREGEIVTWLEANDPDGLRRLMRVKERDPVAYMGHLVRAARIMERAERDPAVVERHKKMRRLEREIREIADGFDDLESKDQKTARKELEALVGDLFGHRQDERRVTLEELESKIAELREEIEERDEDRKAIIDDYVDQLVRSHVDL
jgi:uncharacterized coiled-coil protein SlyX